ncbi:MAG: hypothetical protein KDM64_11485, partial [Verrucomicrobiae bacterium]|nr:hypothetical protein [Verrucomicrobiae bacterium]
MPLTLMNRVFAAAVLGLFLASPMAAAEPTAEAIRDMPIVATLGCGRSMDVAVSGDRMYVIGDGKLHVADISEPLKPRLLGVLTGLGNTRQIALSGAVVFVGSREDGLFVIDASDAAKPVLLTHYDTIEFATGLALAGEVLFVACRQYGVELVDVSEPRHPKHLCAVRTGEAQSVAYHEGYLYAGVWGSSEVVTVDVRQARSPRMVSRVPLDGYGDGVEVRDGFLYAATGHHSREAHAGEGDPGYGHGHGLEIFDLADPAQPAFLGRVKFPPFYAIGNDMWGVTVREGHAFVADTHNGIFLVDVRDPRNPKVIGRTQLPVPEGRSIPGFFGGLALGRDCIYGAGGWTDLHLIPVPGLAQPVDPDTGTPPGTGPVEEPKNEALLTSWRSEGQVHAVAVAEEEDFAVAACGGAGLQVIRLGEASLEPVEAVPTEDFATDVCLLGRLVYASEGTGGLSIWELTGEGKLVRKGTYRVPGGRVRYAAVP